VADEQSTGYVSDFESYAVLLLVLSKVRALSRLLLWPLSAIARPLLHVQYMRVQNFNTLKPS